jgi:hypothetical protein
MAIIIGSVLSLIHINCNIQWQFSLCWFSRDRQNELYMFSQLHLIKHIYLLSVTYVQHSSLLLLKCIFKEIVGITTCLYDVGGDVLIEWYQHGTYIENYDYINIAWDVFSVSYVQNPSLLSIKYKWSLQLSH